MRWRVPETYLLISIHLATIIIIVIIVILFIHSFLMILKERKRDASQLQFRLRDSSIIAHHALFKLFQLIEWLYLICACYDFQHGVLLIIARPFKDVNSLRHKISRLRLGG